MPTIRLALGETAGGLSAMDTDRSDWPAWVGDGVALVAAGFVFNQLRLQRRQLKGQQQAIEGEFERNKKRDELVDQQLRVLLRQQAEKVVVEVTSHREAPPGLGLAPDDRAHVVKVANRSQRPIWNLMARIDPNRSGGFSVMQGYYPAAKPGTYIPLKGGGTVFGEFNHGDRAPLLGAEDECMIGFGLSVKQFSSPEFRIRFDDDTDLHWEVDQDLHLRQLNERDW